MCWPLSNSVQAARSHPGFVMLCHGGGVSLMVILDEYRGTSPLRDTFHLKPQASALLCPAGNLEVVCGGGGPMGRGKYAPMGQPGAVVSKRVRPGQPPQRLLWSPSGSWLFTHGACASSGSSPRTPIVGIGPPACGGGCCLGKGHVRASKYNEDPCCIGWQPMQRERQAWSPGGGRVGWWGGSHDNEHR